MQLDLDFNTNDSKLHLDLSLLTLKYCIPSPKPIKFSLTCLTNKYKFKKIILYSR